MFSKTERSTFPYWFAHWCAFQMTALNHRMWKPRYLLHDFEKPWLKLFLPYEAVQKHHRIHSRHHVEWIENKLNRYDIVCLFKKFDFEAMIIDWECSRFTKESSPRTARQELEYFISEKLGEYPKIKKYSRYFIETCRFIMNKYNFE